MPITVYGTDGKIPVLAPPGWHMYSMSEVYFHEGPALNKYVPKVGDYVKDTDNNIDYITTYVDPTTLHPTLVSKPAASEGALSSDEILSSLDGNMRGISSFVYIDKSSLPYRLNVDAGMYVYHPDASYAKIYLGASLVGSPQVISQIYNGNGQVISNNIPLQAVALNNINNVAIRGIGSCYTTADVPDRSIVTIGVYSAANTLIYSRQMFVENTTFIRDLNSTDKVISHVSLSTPYMSNTVVNQINIPRGTIPALNNFTAVVHYLDGSTLNLPIDGSRCRLSNMDSLSYMVIEGSTCPIGLVYTLQPGEQAQGVTSYDNHTILSEYIASIVAPEFAYGAKLFAFPVWSGAVYTLKWYLYSLSRNYRFVVPSNLLTFSGTAFDGSLHGEIQTLQVSVNLNEVNGALNPYTHSQTVKVTLLDDGSASGDIWRVKHSNVPSEAYYTNANAIGGVGNVITLTAGASTVTQWLNKVYYSNYPAIIVESESQAILPTHVNVVYNGETHEIAVGSYNTPITFTTTVSANTNVYLEFISRTSGTDLLLGCCAMPVKNA